MVAKGRDASPLFPAVVKNVACKNFEVGMRPRHESYLFSRSDNDLFYDLTYSRDSNSLRFTIMYWANRSCSGQTVVVIYEL